MFNLLCCAGVVEKNNQRRFKSLLCCLRQVEHVYSGQVYVDGGGAGEATFTTSNM